MARLLVLFAQNLHTHLHNVVLCIFIIYKEERETQRVITTFKRL